MKFSLIRAIRVCPWLILLLVFWNGSSQIRSTNVKALVGGTLIDGYGSTPIHNSIVIVEGERIKAVGQVGTLAIPPGAEVISTEGMTVLPGLWDMHVHLMINGHADYEHWDKTYPARFRDTIMPASAKQLLLAGVDVIKLIDQDQMSEAEVRAVVDEAHAHKLPVVAHAHRPEEVRRGL